MDKRDWSPPAGERPRRLPPAPSGAEAPPPPGALWTARFVLNMMFFAVIATLSSSRFPLCLGIVLFATNEDFIEWALQAIGIRLVPDTLGAVFVKTAIFLLGWTILLASWKDSAPGWLSSQLPSAAAPLSFVFGGALLFAALSAASAAVMTHLLPEMTRGTLAWNGTRAAIALVMFGMLAVCMYAFRPLEGRVSGEFPQLGLSEPAGDLPDGRAGPKPVKSCA